MIKIILIVLVAIALAVLLVWLIDKFIPQKLKWLVNLVLWALILFLGYQVFMSVYEPIKFNKVKEKRYAEVIKNLVDIRDSQLAYRQVNGKFANNFNELVNFIEQGEYTITQRKDSTVVDEELTRRYGGVITTKDIVIIDTLGTVPVKDSLFKGSDRYKTMMNVPTAKEGTTFTMKAGLVNQNDINIPVFEAKVLKKDILYDQPSDLIITENQVVSVDGVNGDALTVGSLEEVQTSGNWPKTYGFNE